jgi:hypothetical protein
VARVLLKHHQQAHDFQRGYLDIEAFSPLLAAAANGQHQADEVDGNEQAGQREAVRSVEGRVLRFWQAKVVDLQRRLETRTQVYVAASCRDALRAPEILHKAHAQHYAAEKVDRDYARPEHTYPEQLVGVRRENLASPAW